MRTLGTILSLLLVSSTTAAAESRQSSDVAIYTAEQAVSARFHYAAVFRNVSAYRPDSSVRAPQAVCGEVHARNGYDLYDGYRVFVWLPAAANMRSDGEHGTTFIGSEANGFLSLCKNAI